MWFVNHFMLCLNDRIVFLSKTYQELSSEHSASLFRCLVGIGTYHAHRTLDLSPPTGKTTLPSASCLPFHRKAEPRAWTALFSPLALYLCLIYKQIFLVLCLARIPKHYLSGISMQVFYTFWVPHSFKNLEFSENIFPLPFIPPSISYLHLFELLEYFSSLLTRISFHFCFPHSFVNDHLEM